MPRLLIVTAILLLALPRPARADWDLTLFFGRAYPTFEDQLILRVDSVPNLPGVEVTPTGPIEIQADGGPVFGGALAWEFGVIGIEGRADFADIGFDLRGTRYDLMGTEPPLTGLTGSVTVGDGRFDADRLNLYSINLRLRTPGPVGLVASGGLSYLPDVSISGTVPLEAQVPGLPPIPGLAPRLRLDLAPGESKNRWGVNGGAGLRIGGRHVAVMAEARVFYFREYDLQFGIESAPPFIEDLLETLDPVQFEPIIVNAQAGLVIRF
jgi:hypothetical protein